SGRKLGTKGIAAGCGKQAVDFAEHTEIHSGRKNEDDWDVAKDGEGQHHERCRPERDKHRMLAADGVREPTEERTAEAVEDPVERYREGQCRHLKAQKTYGLVRDLEVMCDRRDLGCRHQTARGDYHNTQT